ncbi:unnamed protein product [Amoebophrya sp. A25]|nr:unnamed protein product [Amoebophrya sp. A25]|eukprot:GSA25T00022315001.1
MLLSLTQAEQQEELAGELAAALRKIARRRGESRSRRNRDLGFAATSSTKALIEVLETQLALIGDDGDENAGSRYPMAITQYLSADTWQRLVFVFQTALQDDDAPTDICIDYSGTSAGSAAYPTYMLNYYNALARGPQQQLLQVAQVAGTVLSSQDTTTSKGTNTSKKELQGTTAGKSSTPSSISKKTTTTTPTSASTSSASANNPARGRLPPTTSTQSALLPRPTYINGGSTRNVDMAEDHGDLLASRLLVDFDFADSSGRMGMPALSGRGTTSTASTTAPIEVREYLKVVKALIEAFGKSKMVRKMKEITLLVRARGRAALYPPKPVLVVQKSKSGGAAGAMSAMKGRF